jgi:predicted ATPase/DNA-binding winged helix-turn-helix (wHTH) protein
MRQFSPSSAQSVIDFGAFRLFPAQRRLLRGKEPVKLGSRAFDLLLALAERPGEVVSQKELLTTVWPDVFVEEVSLRVHIAALRKALGDGPDGIRYLINYPGRGYTLGVHATHTIAEQTSATAFEHSAGFTLPPMLKDMVGRADILEELGKKLRKERFVSVVGPGGVGKTTVALSLAHQVWSEFEGAVCFIEFSPVAEAERLAATVAAALQLPVTAKNPLPELLAFLRDKRVLLVLDSCEHLIDHVADLAQRLFDSGGETHVLATSREALRTEAEHILPLPSLETPPDRADLSAEDARRYPAVELFLGRLSAAGVRESLYDEDVQAAGEICRRLDGIALAIELVASRAAAFGIRDTAVLLDSQLSLTWPGRRTAPPRQQTLNATLEWSYGLLSEAERKVLDRLSTFAGSFTFDAAQTVSGGDLGEEDVSGALGGLLAKSLLSRDSAGSAMRYRLLDTTRMYARGKLAAAGEHNVLRQRHAHYYRALLTATAEAGAVAGEPVATAADLDEVRAALQWAFGEGEDALLGADLAAQSAALWLSRALLTEARGWMAKAAEACIDSAGPSNAQQLRLQIAVASTELFSSGYTEATVATWRATLDRAAALGDMSAQFLSYLVLWGREIRGALYRDALVTAEQCAALASRSSDSSDQAMAQWMLGHSKHHVGRFEEARGHLQRYLQLETEPSRFASTKQTGNDRWVNSQGVLSSVLWILGFPEQAKRRGDAAVADAHSTGFAIALGLGMTWAVLNSYLMETDVDAIEHDLVELLEHGRAHKIGTDEGWALCLMGLCQAKRDRFDAAAPMIAEGLRQLERTQMVVFNTLVRAHTCEAAIRAGRFTDARAWADELERNDEPGDHWSSAEVLRVKGLLAFAEGDVGEAERLMTQALQLARRQGARAWELRSAISLSEVLRGQGRTEQALTTLEDAHAPFREGHQTADLLFARRLIEALRSGA